MGVTFADVMRRVRYEALKPRFQPIQYFWVGVAMFTIAALSALVKYLSG